MKILVTDDDPISRHLTARTLTQAGWEVVCATDGDEAWRLLCAQLAPRMAILDWMMPSPNGLELCRMVRAQSSSRYTYIILLTARNSELDMQAARDAGVDDYLTKPFRQDELILRIQSGERALKERG